MAPARQSQLACTQLGQGRGAGGPQLIGRRADDLEIEIEAVGLSSLQDRTCWRALEPRWRITGRHAQRMLFSFVTRWCPRQRASSVSPTCAPYPGYRRFRRPIRPSKTQVIDDFLVVLSYKTHVLVSRHTKKIRPSNATVGGAKRFPYCR